MWVIWVIVWVQLHIKMWLQPPSTCRDSRLVGIVNTQWAYSALHGGLDLDTAPQSNGALSGVAIATHPSTFFFFFFFWRYHSKSPGTKQWRKRHCRDFCKVNTGAEVKPALRHQVIWGGGQVCGTTATDKPLKHTSEPTCFLDYDNSPRCSPRLTTTTQHFNQSWN